MTITSIVEWLPLDVVEAILHRLNLPDVYALRCTSHGIERMVRQAQSQMLYHCDTFGGVSSKNLCLLARDFALNYVPLVTDKMTLAAFKVYAKKFRPTRLHLNSGSCTRWLYKSVLRRTPSCLSALSLDIDQASIRSLIMSSNLSPRFNPQLRSLTLNALDELTIDMMMDVMKLKEQHVHALTLSGSVRSMDVIYSLLPHSLRQLRIEATVGVHDVSSLTRFIELNVEELCLLQCYEVCAHRACANYVAIAQAILRARSFPAQLSLSPFPKAAVQWCLEKGVTVDFDESGFFDHELDMIYSLIPSS